MPTQNLLNQAISRAAADAEVRRFRMSRSLTPGRLALELAAQAQIARASLLGSDQLLALALNAATQPGDFQAPALDALRLKPDPLQQFQLRREVYAHNDDAQAAALAKAAPDWVLRKIPARARHNSQLLAQALRLEADLNVALWDHPALPAPVALRARMLACVVALRDKARAVSRKTIRSKFARPQGVHEWVSA